MEDASSYSSARRPAVRGDLERRSQTTILRAPIDPKRNRRRLLQVLWVFVDTVAMLTVVGLTAWLLERTLNTTTWTMIGIMLAARVVLFVLLGMYRAVLRYTGLHTLLITLAGVVAGSGLALSSEVMLGLEGTSRLGRQFWIMEALLAIGVIGGLRLGARMVLEYWSSYSGTSEQQRVLIFGAGSLGELALRNLLRAPGYKPVAFLDDDQHIHRRVIHGRPVLGGLAQLDTAIARCRPNLIVVAIADPPASLTKTIFRAGMAKGIHVLLAKGVSNAFDEQAGSQLGLRDLALEDLLRRPARDLDERPVREMLSGRRLLVTGAGGSIGSDLCRQVAAMGVSELHVLDHSEFALYQVQMALGQDYPHLNVQAHLVSLTNGVAVASVFASAKPHIALHAAAYKHVPLVEANPGPGIYNNVLGFANVLEAAERYGVESTILISTDKAVRPTNVMGASKRVCEVLMQAHAAHPQHRMRCCAVRFGNVLGSSGSVVPLFLKQIQAGGPITVTHPDITRYFMLIPEAVSLVLQAAARSTRAAEIFILNMGEPVRIADLARQLIFMHGKRPDDDIEIVYSGLRPGEKLYEELLIDESASHTDIPDITVAAAAPCDWEHVLQTVRSLITACDQGDVQQIVEVLQHLVPEWRPSAEMRAATGVARDGKDGSKVIPIKGESDPPALPVVGRQSS